MHAAGLDIKVYHKFSQIEQLEWNKLKKYWFTLSIRMKYLSMFANYVKMQIFTDWTIGAEETKETTSRELLCVPDSVVHCGVLID